MDNHTYEQRHFNELNAVYTPQLYQSPFDLGTGEGQGNGWHYRIFRMNNADRSEYTFRVVLWKENGASITFYYAQNVSRFSHAQRLIDNYVTRDRTNYHMINRSN